MKIQGRLKFMDIERLTKGIGKICAKVFFNREEKSSDKIDIEQMSSTDIFKIMFNSLYNKGNYNKAENIVFYELEKNNSPELYEIAFDFYNLLLKKSDEELLKSNFSKEEIYQGLEDIKKLKIKRIKNSCGNKRET